MSQSTVRAEEVFRFWFEETPQESWFTKDDAFDALLRARFLDTLESAARGECASWRTGAQGRLAEIIVLDQFSRNIFRGSPRAFAQDSQALTLAQEAVALRLDQKLPVQQRAFLYMPYMHSESLLIHDEAVKLFSQKGLEFNLKFEKAHREQIVRFGRYPHRNSVLGRKSTPEEIDFIQTHAGF